MSYANCRPFSIIPKQKCWHHTLQFWMSMHENGASYHWILFSRVSISDKREFHLKSGWYNMGVRLNKIHPKNYACSSCFVVFYCALVQEKKSLVSRKNVSLALAFKDVSKCITWVDPELGIRVFNTSRLRQNGGHFSDDIFKCFFFNESIWISIEISLVCS